jgi:hypothetical protein
MEIEPEADGACSTVKVDQSRAQGFDQRCRSAGGSCSDSQSNRLTSLTNSPHDVHGVYDAG